MRFYWGLRSKKSRHGPGVKPVRGTCLADTRGELGFVGLRASGLEQRFELVGCWVEDEKLLTWDAINTVLGFRV